MDTRAHSACVRARTPRTRSPPEPFTAERERLVALTRANGTPRRSVEEIFNPFFFSSPPLFLSLRDLACALGSFGPNKVRLVRGRRVSDDRDVRRTSAARYRQDHFSGCPYAVARARDRTFLIIVLRGNLASRVTERIH